MDGKMSNTLVSSMTTRPLKCVVDNHNINLYYVDFLCVHKRYRKKGMAPNPPQYLPPPGPFQSLILFCVWGGGV